MLTCSLCLALLLAPDTLPRPEDPVVLLLETLVEEGVYTEEELTRFIACEQYMDGGYLRREGLSTDSVRRKFVDVVLREDHPPGGPGHPLTAPMADAFRYYPRNGGVLRFHRLLAEFRPLALLPDPGEIPPDPSPQVTGGPEKP